MTKVLAYVLINLRISRKLNAMIYSTEQRNILLSFLSENPDKMFSAKQIESGLAGKGISKSAIYRNLAELEAEEKIRRCSKPGSREMFYQFYDCQACRSHIHLSCSKCGKIFHMEDSQAQRLISALEQAEGFEINKGESTLIGVCRECASSK